MSGSGFGLLKLRAEELDFGFGFDFCKGLIKIEKGAVITKKFELDHEKTKGVGDFD